MRRPQLLLTVCSVLAWPGALAAQELFEETIDVDGVMREYLLYVPASYDASSPAPLLFNLHGWGDQAEWYLDSVDMRPIAEREGVILIYPQALVGDEGEPVWNSEGPYSTGVDDVGFIDAVIDATALAFAIDQRRVYACGFSSACSVIWDLSCRLSHRIAAVGTVAGVMWNWTHDECTPVHATPVVTVHGTDDFIMPYDGSPYSLSLTETSEYWSGFSNADAYEVERLPDLDPSDGSTVEKHTWSNGDRCVSVEHFRVIDGGHTWPGVSGNMDIDAIQVIWEFVSKHDLGGRIGCRDLSTPSDSPARADRQP